MKILCNVCEAAEANFLCCTDEAALCWACDQRVHAANKFAGKHQRVSLSESSSQMPKCDICQETVGYFFCLEDRALLCRRCDVAIHTLNSLVSKHQRFLLTGVKVGVEATEAVPSSSSPMGKTAHSQQIDERRLGGQEPPRTTRTIQGSSTGQSSRNLPFPGGDFSSQPFTGGDASQWQLDEFLELGDYNQTYDFMDHQGSSKADCGKLGDQECSPILRVADAELEGDDPMGQAPDAFWAVPKIPSPPTASGLCWPKFSPNMSDSAALFVSDAISLPLHNLDNHHLRGDSSKRRRRF